MILEELIQIVELAAKFPTIQLAATVTILCAGRMFLDIGARVRGKKKSNKNEKE